MRLLNNTGHMKNSLKGNEMIRDRIKKLATRTAVYTTVGFVAGYYVGRNYNAKIVVKKVK